MRRARNEDLRSIAGLYIASAAHHESLDSSAYRVPSLEAVIAYYDDFMAQAEGEVFVAADGPTILGMVEVRLSPEPLPHSMLQPRRVANAGIVVSGDHRRRGIGTSLMAAAESWASERGAELMMLDMLRANSSANPFYASLGYAETGSILTKPLGGA